MLPKPALPAPGRRATAAGARAGGGLLPAGSQAGGARASSQRKQPPGIARGPYNLGCSRPHTKNCLAIVTHTSCGQEILPLRMYSGYSLDVFQDGREVDGWRRG